MGLREAYEKVIYEREDFEPVFLRDDVFFCPGCNGSADDYCIRSVGCPCASHGTASGSLKRR